MSKLWITELQMIGPANSGAQGQIPLMPPVNVQTPITMSGTSQQSAALAKGTTFVRLRADAACHIAVGISPTATTNDTPLEANSPEYFGVPAGHKIAVIAAA